MPLRPWEDIAADMEAQGLTREQRANVEQGYQDMLEHGVPGESRVDLSDHPATDAEKAEVYRRLTGQTYKGEDTREDVGLIGGILRGAKAGYEGSTMAELARRAVPAIANVPRTVSPEDAPLTERIARGVGGLAGSPLAAVGSAFGAPGMAVGFGAERLARGQLQGEPLSESAKHAAVESIVGGAAGVAGPFVERTIGTPLVSQIAKLGTEAGIFGGGGELGEAAVEGRNPSLQRAVRGTEEAAGVMGALHLLRAGGDRPARRGGARIRPTNEPADEPPGVGAGSTSPGPDDTDSGGGDGLPHPDPSWVSERTPPGTGGGSTPPDEPSWSFGTEERVPTGEGPAFAFPGEEPRTGAIPSLRGQVITGGPEPPPPGTPPPTIGANQPFLQQYPDMPRMQELRQSMEEQQRDRALELLDQWRQQHPDAPEPSAQDTAKLWEQAGEDAAYQQAWEQHIAQRAPVPEGMEPPMTPTSRPLPPPEPSAAPPTPMPYRPGGMGIPPDIAAPEPPPAAAAPPPAGPPAPIIGELVQAREEARARAAKAKGKARARYEGQVQAYDTLIQRGGGEPPGEARAAVGAPAPSPPPAPRPPAPVIPITRRAGEVVGRAEPRAPSEPVGPPAPPAEPPPPPEPPEPQQAKIDRLPPEVREHVMDMLDEYDTARRSVETGRSEDDRPLDPDQVESARAWQSVVRQWLDKVGITPRPPEPTQPAIPLEGAPAAPETPPAPEPTQTAPPKPAAPEPPAEPQKPTYASGDPVRVTTGVYKGVEGTVVKVRAGKGRGADRLVQIQEPSGTKREIPESKLERAARVPEEPTGGEPAGGAPPEPTPGPPTEEQIAARALRRLPKAFDPYDPLGSARYLLEYRSWKAPELLTRAERETLERSSRPEDRARVAAYDASMFRRNNWQQPLAVLFDAGDVLSGERGAHYRDAARRLDAAATAAGTFEGKPMPPELVAELRSTLADFEHEATAAEHAARGERPPTERFVTSAEQPPEPAGPGTHRASEFRSGVRVRYQGKDGVIFGHSAYNAKKPWTSFKPDGEPTVRLDPETAVELLPDQKQENIWRWKTEAPPLEPEPAQAPLAPPTPPKKPGGGGGKGGAPPPAAPAGGGEAVGWPVGKRVKAKTPNLPEMEFRYELVPASTLVASHDIEGRRNPDFPEEAQPRRVDEGSRLTMQKIARDLDPEQLGESRLAGQGAPIVDDHNVVEVGNHRVAALQKAATSGEAEHSESFGAYQDWLQAHAERFGLDPAAVERMAAKGDAPVLVRRRLAQLDPEARRRFILDANESPAQGRAAGETATADADLLTPDMLAKFRPDERGDLLAASNDPFIREFFAKVVPENQRKQYTDAKGNLNQAGLQRMRAAVVGRVYAGEPGLLERLTEDPDDNVRNVSSALQLAVPAYAKLRNAIDEGQVPDTFDITPELATAAQKLSYIRREGMKVGDYLKQQDVFERPSPRALRLLEVLDQHGRSSKRMAEIVSRYADLARTRAGEKGATPDTLIDAAVKSIEAGPLFGGGGTTLASGFGVFGEFGRRRAPQENLGRAGEAVAGRIAFTPPPGPALAERMAGGAQRAYDILLDDLQPFKRAVDVVAESGEPLAVSRNPYHAAHLSRNWWGKVERALYDHPVNWKTLAPETDQPGLESILAPLKGDTRGLDVYLAARNTVERLVPKGVKTAILPETAARAMEELGPRYKAIADQVDQFFKHGLEVARDAGLITPELQGALADDPYMPLWQVAEEDRPLPIRGGPGKRFVNLMWRPKRVGPDAPARPYVPPLESAIKNYATIWNVAERNRVAQLLVGLKDRPGGEQLGIKEVPPQLRPVATLTGGEIARGAATAEAGVTAENVRDVLRDELGIELGDAALKIFRPSLDVPNDGKTVRVFQAGKAHYYELPPDLYRAAHALDAQQLGVLGRFLSPGASLLRAGATLTPEFALAKNPLRDQFTAFTQTKYGYQFGLDFLRGLFHVVKQDNAYWDFVSGGGAHSALVSLDRPYMQDAIRELTGAPGTVKERLLGATIRPLQQLSEAFENATRIGEHERALAAEGRTVGGRMKAGRAAQEVTVNFGRHGSLIQQLNPIIAFLNANVQGPDRFARAIKDRPVQTLARVAASAMLPAAALWAYAHDDKRYQEATPEERDRYWIIPTPWREAPYKFPKDFQIGVGFASLTERVLDYLQDKDPKGMKEWAGSFLDSLTPPYLPTALAPEIENWMNRGPFGTPLVSEFEQRQLPPAMQGARYASETAKVLGKTFNYPPSKIDNLISGHLGGLGVLGREAIDIGLRAAGEEGPEPPTRTAADYPIIRSFTMRYPSLHAESIERFYDSAEQSTQALQGAKRMLQRDPEAARAFAREHLVDIALSRPLAQMARTFSQGRKALDVIRNDRQLSGDEKRERSDEIIRRMIDMARQANAGVRRMRAQGAGQLEQLR